MVVAVGERGRQDRLNIHPHHIQGLRMKLSLEVPFVNEQFVEQGFQCRGVPIAVHIRFTETQFTTRYNTVKHSWTADDDVGRGSG